MDKLQFDKVLGYIESGKAQGASLKTGGNRHGDTGFFVESTVFADVTVSMMHPLLLGCPDALPTG